MEEVDKPGPKPRPALVKRASGDQDGNPWLHVTYGTTKEVTRRGINNFIVSNVLEMDLCGLWCATRFRLDRVVLLPWAEEFFIDAPGRASPVMGRLSEHAVQLLRYQATIRQKRALEKEPELPIDEPDE